MCLAREFDPAVDVDEELDVIAALAAACPDDLAGLRAYLFGTLGFTGDSENYYDPRNSFLHAVVRRRRGIPISLSVIAMEVGRRRGVPLVGIGLPGHFLTRSEDDRSAYLDAFSGQLLTLEGVERLFATISGGGQLEAAWLEPVGPVDILRRMLNNLRRIYDVRFVEDGGRRLLATVELDLLLPDAGREVRAARAACLARMLHTGESIAEFVALADESEKVGDEEEADRWRRQIRAATALVN